MLNIGIANDISWDNFILINNKFKKIDTEKFRLHAIYSKSLSIINTCASRNFLTLLRHYSDSLSKTTLNLLKICDIWIIFTNFTEYNTQTQYIIDKCDKFGIKYIIVSEFSRTVDYYSFQCDKELSFKKILNTISKKNEISELLSDFDSEDDAVYNSYFNKSCQLNLTITPEIKQLLKQSYQQIEQYKRDHTIKLLYDKDEIKKEKLLKRNMKTMSQIEFNQRRQNYYKK